jgi:hypothetical protein
MRTIPDPGFPGDEGAADDRLTAALASYDAEPGSRARWLEAVAALQDTRVLVPVVATPAGGRAEPVGGRAEPDGGRAESLGGRAESLGGRAESLGGRAESRPDDTLTDMSAVLMQGRTGSTALLAFTGLDSLHTWDPGARPVPVAVPLAARAALQNGASALVVDVAGPVLLAVEDDDLRSLAQGHRLLEVSAGRWGWVRSPAGATDSP